MDYDWIIVGSGFGGSVSALRLAEKGYSVAVIEAGRRFEEILPNPTYIDGGNKAAQWIAERTGRIAQSMILEATANFPTTAHILGGAVVGKDGASGVVDSEHRVFGYKNMLVCDGAAVPANPGVNPSLTIAAMAERAMSKIPAKRASD